MLQLGRTAYSAEALDEFADEMAKRIIETRSGLTKEQLDTLRIGYSHPGRAAVGYAIQLFPLLIDLEWRLLTISNDLEFVTSDNPVVLYNQFMSFRHHGSNTGLAAKGLQVFLPLSPKIALMLYDRNVYGVSSRNSQVVEVNAIGDVEQVNRLQFIAALESVYFCDAQLDVVRMFEGARRFRRTQKNKMEVLVEEKIEAGYKNLVQSSSVDIRTDLTLSFVRILKKAKNWQRTFQKTEIQPAVVVRNSNMVQTYEDFIKLVHLGKYAPKRVLQVYP